MTVAHPFGVVKNGAGGSPARSWYFFTDGFVSQQSFESDTTCWVPAGGAVQYLMGLFGSPWPSLSLSWKNVTHRLERQSAFVVQLASPAFSLHAKVVPEAAHTWFEAQVFPHVPQFGLALFATHALLQQSWLELQQVVPQAMVPAAQAALHAVPAALQPVDGQVVVVEVQVPLPSQTGAVVALPAVQTGPPPHEVFRATFEVAEQTGAAVALAQVIVKFLQGLGVVGVQVAPATHWLPQTLGVTRPQTPLVLGGAFTAQSESLQHCEALMHLLPDTHRVSGDGQVGVHAPVVGLHVSLPPPGAAGHATQLGPHLVGSLAAVHAAVAATPGHLWKPLAHGNEQVFVVLHSGVALVGTGVQSVLMQQLPVGMHAPLHILAVLAHGKLQVFVVVLHTPVVLGGPDLQSVSMQHCPALRHLLPLVQRVPDGQVGVHAPVVGLHVSVPLAGGAGHATQLGPHLVGSLVAVHAAVAATPEHLWKPLMHGNEQVFVELQTGIALVGTGEQSVFVQQLVFAMHAVPHIWNPLAHG